MKHYPVGFYKQILNSMSDMVLVKGEKSKLLWANAAFLAYYGMTEEQLQAIVDAPHSNPDDTLQYIKDDHFVFTHGNHLEVGAEPITRHDGKVKYYHTMKDPVKDEQGKIIMTVGCSRLVDDLTLIEKSDVERQERKDSTSELKALIGALPSPTIMLDASNRIISYSEEWKEAFPQEKLDIYQSFDDVYWHNLADLTSSIKEVLITGKLKEKKGLQVITQGRQCCFDLKIKPWFFPNGDLGGTIVMANDITVLQDLNLQLEEKVALRTKELTETLNNLYQMQSSLIEQEKHASLGRMAGKIAHEINNPLSIISASMLLLKQKMLNNQLTGHALDNILMDVESTVKRMSQIIIGLSTVSRKSKEFSMSEVNLKDIFDDVSALCLQRFMDNGIELLFEPALDQMNKVIKCDRVQFSQVFLNLLNNSFDAIENLPYKWVKIKIEETADMDVMRLTDSGQGISKEIVEKLFEPFFTSKPVGRGTGLGLAISRSIIEKHGGSIEFDTEDGYTSFIIKIPRL